MSTRDRRVTIVINETASDADVQEIQQLLDGVQVSAKVEATYDSNDSERASWTGSRRKAFRTDTAGAFSHDPDWIALLIAPVNQLASDLGVEGLKSLVGRLWSTRARQAGGGGKSGLVVIVDEETGIRLILERDLPNDAYDVLKDLDIRAFQADPLQFYRVRGRHGRWRSPDNVSGTG